jgi:arylsulfatase A-like enzyme
MRFTAFYVNAPVCSPTRAGFLTGRSQHRCGAEAVFTHITPGQGLPLDETTIADLLKKNGYATGLFGKWHLGYEERFHPLNRGFDKWVGHLSGHQDYVSHARTAGATGDYDWWHDRKQTREKGYATDLITKHSIQFIEQHKSEPFFLFVSHAAPHSPYQGPNDSPLREVGESVSKRQSEEERDAKYIEMVEYMDKGVGRVMDAVSKAGIEEQTLVLFFSDNGPSWQAGTTGGLKGNKHTLWEGGIRVPAVVSMPGSIKPGGVTDQPLTVLDLFPTFLGLAGAGQPRDLELDGIDVRPLFFDGKKLPRRALCWKHGPQKAVRDGKWKLYARFNKKTNADDVWLSNLEEDQTEQNNVAEANPEIVARLKKVHAEWEEGIARDGKRLRRVSGEQVQ